jgi:hypothetical protein
LVVVAAIVVVVVVAGAETSGVGSMLPMWNDFDLTLNTEQLAFKLLREK